MRQDYCACGMVSRDMNRQIQILLLKARRMKTYRKSAWPCKRVNITAKQPLLPPNPFPNPLASSLSPLVVIKQTRNPM